jgi:hypothetical protein
LARRKKQTSIIGAVLVAIVLGLIIGVVIFNPYDPPLPPPPEIEHTEEYDDEWGKLDSPLSQAKVTHILISWKGKSARVTPKDPERTKEEARELVEEIWHKYRNNPTKGNWEYLQAEYNEDTQPHNEYDLKGGPGGRNTDGMDPEFSKTGRSIEVGKARICESAFGFHLIRREK